MLRRDLLLVSCTAVISSLVTYLACAAFTRPQAPRHEPIAANGIVSAPPNHTEHEIAQVERGKEGPVGAGVFLQDSSLRDNAGQPDTGTTQDPALAIQRSQELGDRFSRLLGNDGNADSSRVSAKVENRFYSEEWNQEWAGSKERSIRTLFDANKDLSGITPLQVTCRSKNCQVVFSASNQDQVRLVSEKFMKAATRGDVGMKDKLVSFFPDVSMGRLVFYLSEDGNRDLFQ